MKDVLDTELHPALEEAVEMGRRALRDRDADFDRNVLVVASEPEQAFGWIARHQRSDGATCRPVGSHHDFAAISPPVTVVILDGAQSRDDWPQLAAEIAVLGDSADVITQNGRSRA